MRSRHAGAGTARTHAGRSLADRSWRMRTRTPMYLSGLMEGWSDEWLRMGTPSRSDTYTPLSPRTCASASMVTVLPHTLSPVLATPPAASTAAHTHAAPSARARHAQWRAAPAPQRRRARPPRPAPLTSTAPQPAVPCGAVPILGLQRLDGTDVARVDGASMWKLYFYLLTTECCICLLVPHGAPAGPRGARGVVVRRSRRFFACARCGSSC